MNDLVTWLRAQLDEVERVAREALDVDARTFPPPEFTVEYQWARMTRHTSGGGGHGFAVGAPSPARVLAEVAAKRRILDEVVGGLAMEERWARHFAEHLARLLALPYADQTGYREEWRP